MTIKPSRLEPDQKIGIIAPGGPVKQSDLTASLDILRDRDYQVIISPNLLEQRDYLAGDDASRLSDLHHMFEDKDIRAIICARGGYGALRILDGINYDLIQNNPKIFVGYSDITALLLAIHKQTGLIVFHGPMARELAHQNTDNLDSFMSVLSGSNYNKIDINGGKSLRDGIAHGPIMGGNLSIISSMIGTSFMPLLRECILFMEERGESLYRIDRMLTHMRLSGLFKDLSGIVLGGFEDCGEISDIERLLMDVTKDCAYPVLSGLPVGHGKDNRTIPIGINARIDTESMSVTFNEGLVS